MTLKYYDGASVLVDDRAVYDYSGLVTRHRSMYVALCGARLCWETGRPTEMARPRADVPTVAQT